MSKYFQSTFKPTEQTFGVSKVVHILGAAPQHDAIDKQGWIHKKSKHLKQYHKRFMQLKGDKLICYKTDKNLIHETPTEVFDLSFHRYRPEKHEKMKQKFYLIDETIATSRTFKAPSSVDRDDWVYQIRHNIIAGKQLREASVANTNKYYGARSMSIAPLYATFESVMAIKTAQEMHDSESEESDDDFGGSYNSINTKLAKPANLISIEKDLNKQSQRKQIRRRAMSRRKTNYSVTMDSFRNFRIRSLTVDNVGGSYRVFGTQSDDEDDDEEDDNKESKMITLDEEKEQFNGDEQKINNGDIPILNKNTLNEVVVDEKIKDKDKEIASKVYDEAIIYQLKMFGYERNKVIKAMEQVIDSSNINQIKEKLDEEEKVNIADIDGDNEEEQVVEDIVNTEEVLKDDLNGSIVESKEVQDIDPKIEKRAINRQFIEHEIITTEETYYQGLDTLLNELIEPMFDDGYIDKKYYDQIRSSIPKLLQFHKDFLDQLTAVNEIKCGGDNDEKLDKNVKGKTLAAVFNHCIMENKEKFIEIYIEFIKDYDKILDLFGSTFHGNLELETFLREKRGEQKPLSSFLILPVQRVPRYILLLTDLRKNTEETSDDYKDINDAVEMIRDITREINEKKRNIENLSQCLQIQEALNGLKEPIVNDDRVFIEQFIFIKKTIKHQRLLFLFNDIVIVANEKWKVKHILDIRTLDVKIKVDHINDTKRKELPEFKLVSIGSGSVVFIGEDIKTINNFKKLVGKWRVKIMSGDIRDRNDTLGSLKSELNRQALLYD